MKYESCEPNEADCDLVAVAMDPERRLTVAEAEIVLRAVFEDDDALDQVSEQGATDDQPSDGF